MNLSCTFFTEPTPWAFRSPNADLHLVFRRLGSRREILCIGLAPNSRTSRSKTLAIPVPAGETLPNLPSSGIRGREDAQGNSRHASAGWLVPLARTGTLRIRLRENYDASKSLSDSRPIIKTARRRTYRDWEPPFVAYMIGSCAFAKSRRKPGSPRLSRKTAVMRPERGRVLV
jgi:hypothetical protein